MKYKCRENRVTNSASAAHFHKHISETALH